MCLSMLSEIVGPRESFVTLGADIGPLLRMCSDVSKEKQS